MSKFYFELASLSKNRIWIFLGCTVNIYCECSWKSLIFNWTATWDFQQCGMFDQQSFRSTCAYAHLIRAFTSRLNILWMLRYWLNDWTSLGISRLESRLMRGSRSFRQGGPGQSDKKALTTFFFFFFFLVLSLFYRSQMVNFKEIYHFSRFQRGSNIFLGGGGSNFFQGVQLLIPYKNPYNLWFSRGGPDPLSPPLWIRTWGYTGSSESTLVKMPRCWKSHVGANMYRGPWWWWPLL